MRFGAPCNSFHISSRSRAFSMSSSSPIASPIVLSSMNGRIQVSRGGGTIGLLVERGNLFAGTLLTGAQAEELARVLLTSARLHEAAGT
jgi:hypothetical protein